ncbi:DUF3179 domain-containing (seleno)protein [Photobacterium sp. R1]
MAFIFKLAISYQAYYDEPTFPTVEYKDTRLPSKEKIWGLNVGEDYVAYTECFVCQHQAPINVVIGAQDIVLHFDETYESLGVFYNHTGKYIQDINCFGETESGRLARVETVKAGAYWIIWSDFFPQTDVNRL